jgi:flagellin-like hook-associated protein FlgL
MSVSGIGPRSLLTAQSLVDMRAQLGDLQRQMATGKKADTYAGIGLNRGLTVGLRSQLAAIGSYNDTIGNVGVRIDVAQAALTRIGDLGREMKSVSGQINSPIQRTTAQQTARNAVDEILGLLNTQVGDRYIFSGLASDAPAAATTNAVLFGDGLRAGLQQVIAERNQADLGADGLGRLVLTAPTATSVQVAEDFAGSIFGFKLAGIASSLTGATSAGPAGSPPAMSVDLGAASPNAGEQVSFIFNLPDGTTETLVLTATASATPQAGQFTIGATAADTAANLQAALTTSLGTLARTSLSAASAIAASDNFFNMDAANPPLRVDGPPFAATSLTAGTPADTVFWYTGEAGSQPARATATARVDQAVSVSYGLRGNEEGIRWQLQHIAVMAVMPMAETDPDIQLKSTELSERLGLALGVPVGKQSVEQIQVELAGAQTSMGAATERHRETKATLEDLLQNVEGVSTEEVAAKILALQTRLEASLRTTSMLYQTSILNYM